VPLCEVEVVEWLEAELRFVTDLSERDVVLLGLAVRGLRFRDVRQEGEQLVALLTQLGQLRLELLKLGLEGARCVAGLLELRIVGVAGAGGLLDLGRELVLLRADLVDARVQLAAAFVGGEKLVELLGRAASRQRRADGLGVAADLLEIERGSAPSCLGGSRGGRHGRPRRFADVLAGVLGDEGGDLVGVGAHDDVLGHDRPGEAAVADRIDHVAQRLLALIQIRALYALRAVGASLGPRRRQRVASGAALGEDLGALVVRIVVRNLDALCPATGGGRDHGDCDQ
jgi:hypothetical protein